MEVLPICHSSRVNCSLLDFIIFFIAFYVHKLESAQFTVDGPDHPITAIVGEDILLPCHLSPSTSAENMEVRWFRSEFTSYVHLYRQRKDQYEQQMPEYHGRTELWKANITDGNVALKIVNIRPSDEGQYRCFVQDGVFHEEAVLELKVEASGSTPQISVEGFQDGGIRMVCQLAGWYPEPEVLWRDLKGQPLSSFTQTKSQDERGLFEIKSSIIIKENSNQSLSCSMRNRNFNLEMKPPTFYISDSFLPRMSPWMVVWSVTLVILLVVIGITLFLFRLRGKHLDTIGKLHTELVWRRSLSDAVIVTLDPDTAYPRLILSEAGKSVRLGDEWQQLPDNPKRFTTAQCVLCCEGFTSGRQCWDVEVEAGQYWAVGVARESVRRKGQISPSPEEGIWAVRLWVDEFSVLTSPRQPLPQNCVPSRIRVYLDCDKGLVTFFGAGDEAPIFAFPPGSIPKERIHPWFGLWDTETRLRLHP